MTALRAGLLPFGHLNFVICALRVLRPYDPRTDASDHIFVLVIFLLLLLLVFVVVFIVLLLLLLLLVVGLQLSIVSFDHPVCKHLNMPVSQFPFHCVFPLAAVLHLYMMFVNFSSTDKMFGLIFGFALLPISFPLCLPTCCCLTSSHFCSTEKMFVIFYPRTSCLV